VHAEKGAIDRTQSSLVTDFTAAECTMEEFEYRLGQGVGCNIFDDYTSAETIQYKSEGILHRELLLDLKSRQYVAIIL